MSPHPIRILISTCHDGLLCSVRVLLDSLLEARGGTMVTRATVYEQCVHLANSGNYDLVIFFGQTTSPSGTYPDYYPLTNSIRAIREIKAKVTTPIIALSTMPETEQQLISAGADVFLAMPYELEDFRSAVDRCLGGGHCHDEGLR